MKTKFNLLLLSILLLVLSSCAGDLKDTDGGQAASGERKTVRTLSSPGETADSLDALASPNASASLLNALDELAELERSGAWVQGLALTESGLRENAGDYAGAVAAAFKELSWAYGLGLIQKEDLEHGLSNVLGINGEESVTSAANAILAFINERWDESSILLKTLFNELDDPDGFGRWMILVCALEKNKTALSADGAARSNTIKTPFDEERRVNAAYKSIRARYAQFPEYWYRGAKAFSGVIAAEFAENCINTSPQGPFAPECRSILASHTGLGIEDGRSILTKKEIETAITKAVSSSNPQILDSLLPLIGLPDNPYTVYAVGALRALTSVPLFRDYFNKQSSTARGRLAERLSYISRG